ncbi:MAG: diguanylate cyclase [Planctomycetota bacterium]|jgi:diguanylate cyclase (GGDEF)-like protein
MYCREFEELKSSGELPSPTGVGMKVLMLTQQEDCSIDELIEALQVDPAMTGRILKIATSAQVNGGRPVTNLRDAAMRLGLRQVQSVALGFSLVTNNLDGACSAFDYGKYWSRSLARSVAAAKLAAASGDVDVADAFTTSLLGAVGELALASTHPEEYAELLERVRKDPDLDLRLLEHDRFRIDHVEVSAALLRDWGLPDYFAEAVMAVEGDLEGQSERVVELVEVIRDATAVADYCVDGDRLRAESSERLTALSERFGRDGTALTQLCEEVVTDWIEWGEMLDLPTAALADRFDGGTLEARLHGTTRDEGEQGGVRILAVDDDPMTLRILSRQLTDAGHTVEVARNGREALAMTLKLRPQLIVTDWNMPDLDGLEFCRALRRSQFGRRIYVLLLTGNDDEDRVIEGFEAGVDDYITKPFNPRVLLARLRAGVRLIKLQEQVERDQEVQVKNSMQLTRLNRQLKEAANTDFLTKLPNRRCAMGQLERTWEVSVEKDAPMSVIMLDVDNFKAVNDTYGHDVGDVVLQSTAQTIRKALRRQDLAARFGGEEFLIICPNVDEVRAAQIAERVRTAVEESLIQSGEFDSAVTVSMGVATRWAGVSDVDHLLRIADEAVYVAKRSGRNQVRVGEAPEPGDRRTA